MLRDLTILPRQQVEQPNSFVAEVKSAAELAFQPTKYAPRTPWISEDTLRALEEPKIAEAVNDPEAKHKRNRARFTPDCLAT